MQITTIIFLVYSVFYLIGLISVQTTNSIQQSIQNLKETFGEILSKRLLVTMLILSSFISFPVVGFLELRRKLKGE